MTKQSQNFPSGHLPIKHNLTFVFVLSFITAFLMTAASLGGLLFPSAIYPTDELRQSFLTNDLVNLLIGLPVLLASMWLTRRGVLVGLLSWPGALLYVTYNYLAYLFGMPFSWITIIFLALVLISAGTMVALLRSIDSKSVQEQLTGAVPVKTSGWVLLLFGAAFFFRAIWILVEAGTNKTMLPVSEIGVLVADLVVSTLWVAGGALLLRQKPLGYVSGLGLLAVASALYIGLIMFLLLQPVLTGAPFALVDVIVVFIMGLVCFIPFALFMRGVASRT